MNVSFELNGEPASVDVPPDVPLRDVLRESFGLTGVKVGCLSGRCGVCTVHLDGTAVKSCLVMAGKADGRRVTTIEGLADPDDPHPVQAAFEDHFAAQCGYCTPGFVMTAADYVDDGGAPDRDAIRHAVKGNVCRCTGYEKVVDAIRAAADGGA